MVDPLKVRELILHASYQSGHGHIPTSFSVIEMILSTYANMNHDPTNPELENRDIFILSKAHAALGYYCCLAELGYFDNDLVSTFGSAGAILGCHPDRLKQPWTEVSCGSLGHGIGVGAGIALAAKLGKTGQKVFVLIGDGESNEGSVWEALMVAADQGLDNFTVLYDNNGSQSRCLMIDNPAERFRSFGCDVFEVDGHNVDELSNALQRSQTTPKCLVCNTVKGFGCKTLVDEVFAWHRRSPNQDELKLLLEELYA